MNEQVYNGIAGIYDANRANYPRDLMVQFREICRMPEVGGIVIDVGSGTGISKRQLREVFPQDVAVIGIEPGDDMQRTAVANSSHLPNLTFLNFPAEVLPFKRASVDAVFVAQAVHWFDRPKFYAETARVLRSSGILGLIENNRNWRDSPFLAGDETLLETFGNNYSRHYRSFDIEAELQPVSGLVYKRQVSSSQVVIMSKASFVKWSFTSTKMQDCITNFGEDKVFSTLSELMERYFANETAVEIRYKTELFIVESD